jgi:hypothetical protein
MRQSRGLVLGQREKRRRGKSVPGLRYMGELQAPVEAVIAVERSEELHVGPERPDVPPLDPVVGVGKGLRQARGLQADVAVGRLERPFGERRSTSRRTVPRLTPKALATCWWE